VGKDGFTSQEQKIKDRLDEACPDWQVTYSDPVIAGDLVVVRCKLTIASVTREGVGNSDAYKEKNKSGGYSFGSPIECATADAFKNAAEMFGIGAYLDDQEFVVRYLQSKGDGRGTRFYQENDWKDNGAMGRPKNQPTAAANDKKNSGEISREEWLARQTPK
jgi:hypothetical protein